jgi:hypothetical protein
MTYSTEFFKRLLLHYFQFVDYLCLQNYETTSDLEASAKEFLPLIKIVTFVVCFQSSLFTVIAWINTELRMMPRFSQSVEKNAELFINLIKIHLLSCRVESFRINST